LAANSVSPQQAATALAAWNKVDSVLGLGTPLADAAPPELQKLLEDRQAARKAKDFKRADAIRDELKAKGWIIEDTPRGPKLKRLA
jgi:cysteinyl-tRNA synthetase